MNQKPTMQKMGKLAREAGNYLNLDSQEYSAFSLWSDLRMSLVHHLAQRTLTLGPAI